MENTNDIPLGCKKITLEDRLDEIDKAIKLGLYQAALGLALTVPDICRQIEHPGTKGGRYYEEWFDKHVRDKFMPKINTEELNYDKRIMNGKICYKLRCAFLHSGDVEIEEGALSSIKSESDEAYELSYEFILSEDFDSGGSETTYPKGSEENFKKVRKYSTIISIKKLCENICEAAMEYTQEQKNKDAFNEHNSYYCHVSKKSEADW